MGTPIFAITDGTFRVSLVTKNGSGINTLDYTPARQTAKGGGVWADSSLSNGRQLQMRKLSNIIDVITLGISGKDQNTVIEQARLLTKLLEKATYYWITEWQNEPVWIERRGSDETESLYTLIHGYKWENDNNPFAPPFYVPSRPSAMTGIDLAIEHGAWLSNPPGESECVQISNIMVGEVSATEDKPTISSDDAYINKSISSISLNSVYLYMGTDSGMEWDTGVRYRSVDIPAGATIIEAYAVFVGGFTQSGLPKINIYGELNASPSTFSTYADFIGRTKTSTTKQWDITGMGVGVERLSPDIKDIIQEIVNLGGWTSGNDLVLLFENANANLSANNKALPASWDNSSYSEPALIIYYATNNEFGRAETCEDEVYVANKDNEAGIDAIYNYDDSGAAYSGNLVGTATPFDLLPDPLAADDYILFGSTVGPFCSLVFDIEDVADGTAVFAWEYYDGAAWQSLTVVPDKTNYDQFIQSDVGALVWTQPSDWSSADEGVGTVAYWVRARVTTASGNTPTQQNRDIYTVIKSNVDIDKDQISGDLTAITKMNTVTLDTTRGKAEKIIIGLRSNSRGEDFVQHINANGQNDTSITRTLGTHTTAQANLDMPTGAGVQTAFTDPETMERRFYFEIEPPLSNVYYGRYRAFARGIQTDGTSVDDSDIQSYLNVAMGSSTRSKTVGNVGIGNDWHYFDYGIITLPPSILPEVYEGTIRIDVYATNDSGVAVDFDWVDLVLVPVDEHAVEVRQDADAIQNSGDITTLDSVSYIGKSNVFSILRYESDYEIYDIPTVISSGPIQLQANADQRLYWFVPETAKYEWLGRVQVWKNERYLTFKGEG